MISKRVLNTYISDEEISHAKRRRALQTEEEIYARNLRQLIV